MNQLFGSQYNLTVMTRQRSVEEDKDHQRHYRAGQEPVKTTRDFRKGTKTMRHTHGDTDQHEEPLNSLIIKNMKPDFYMNTQPLILPQKKSSSQI